MTRFIMRCNRHFITLCALSVTSLSSFAHGNLSFTYLGRVNTPLDETVGNEYLQLDSGDRKEFTRWDGVYDLSLRMYPSNNKLLYSLPEAYMARHIGRNQYSVGRKIVPWQSNDKFWALGEVNPIRGFNLLETKREGLSGLFYERKTEHWEFIVQASPIHIPQVNPTFEAKDGNIEGKNEWSYPPPKYVRYRDNQVPVHYTLVYPDMQDIILKYSGSLSLAYRYDSGRLGVYGGYKPEPGIRVNATGFYEQFDSERALVKAKPFVNYQTFWGASWDQEVVSPEWKSSLGIEGVIPKVGTDESFEFQALKIQPTYERLTYATYSLGRETTTLKVAVNGIYLIDGDRVNKNVFAKKPKWRRAIGGEFLWRPSYNWSVEALYKYDLKTQDMSLIANLSYQMFKHISVQGGAQLVDAPDDYSFWAPYRSNDSLFTRLSYLF